MSGLSELSPPGSVAPCFRRRLKLVCTRTPDGGGGCGCVSISGVDVLEVSSSPASQVSLIITIVAPVQMHYRSSRCFRTFG